MRVELKEIIKTYKETNSVMDVKYLTPQLAVIERSFRTDEEEFIYHRAPFSDYDELRQEYEMWLKWYNYERPHLGIDL